MRGLIILFIVSTLLAEDCGTFTCVCDSNDQSITAWNLITDAGRRSIESSKTYNHYEGGKCEGKSDFSIFYRYKMDADTNNKTVYTRTLKTESITFFSDVSRKQRFNCSDVIELNHSYDISSSEISENCDKEAIAHYVESKDPHVTQSYVKNNSYYENNSSVGCESTNLEGCYIDYPNRWLLYFSYATTVLAFIAVMVVYGTQSRRRTLPVTKAN